MLFARAYADSTSALSLTADCAVRRVAMPSISMSHDGRHTLALTMMCGTEGQSWLSMVSMAA